MAVQRRKPRGGERLVDRREALYPRISACNHGRERRQSFGEPWDKQARIARAAAVVHQPNDRRYPVRSESSQPLVQPTPGDRPEPRQPLPQYGEANGFDTQLRKPVHVVGSGERAAPLELVAILTSHTIVRAFD